MGKRNKDRRTDAKQEKRDMTKMQYRCINTWMDISSFKFFPIHFYGKLRWKISNRKALQSRRKIGGGGGGC